LYTGLICSVMLLFSAFEYSGGEPAALLPFTTASENYSLPGIYLNPVSVAGNRGLTVSAYCSRPYSEEELHSYTSGIKYSSGDCGLQFILNSFGTGFYREERLNAGTGISPWPFITAGLSASVYRLSINGEGESFSRTMYDADLALMFTPFEQVSLSCIQNCVSTALTGKNSLELYPERSAGATLKPSNGFTMSWNITDTSAGYINSFTSCITPAPFFSLRGAYTPDDSRFSGSASLIIKKLNVTYSISSHPYLGYTHSLGVTFFTGDEIETIRYGKPKTVIHDKKIDLISATDNEIRKLPSLSSRSAERIILYRKKAGPVSEKVLKQLGLDRDEIEYLKSNCYGLSRNNGDVKDKPLINRKKYSPKIFIPRKERIKERFRRMVKAGVPASSAIRYSELPETSRRGHLDSLLDADNSLSREQKELVRQICR